MILLILAVGLFVFAWTQHRANLKKKKAPIKYTPLPNYPAYNPPVQTHTHAEDIAIGAGLGLAAASAYELLSDEDDEDDNSVDNDDYDGYDGGDSGGGGSDGDF